MPFVEINQRLCSSKLGSLVDKWQNLLIDIIEKLIIEKKMLFRVFEEVDFACEINYNNKD